MVVIERASSTSSSSSSRRTERQSLSNENDIHDLLKGKLARRASSLSCPSSSPRKEKRRETCQQDSQERLKEKIIQRANSFTSPSRSTKEKRSMSGLKDNDELQKSKLGRRASSLSSSSVSSPKREKRTLSTCQKDNQVSKEKRPENRKSKLLKSKIRDLGPICKTRKEILNSIQMEEDVDVYLDKQIDEEKKVNPDDCFWLSSGSMSPQEFGLFMSTLDPCIDEWVISFVPNSSRTPTPVDSSREALTGEVLSGNQQAVQESADEEEAKNVSRCAHARSQSLDSSSSLALSTYTDSSSFWNMDRTGVWVSLINLDGEDSNLTSGEESQMDDLDPDFPSPTFGVNCDSYFSDVGVSSSAKSTQESSHSDLSSDLLSDSMDWELDSDDPIFWPFGVDSDWDDQGLDSFSVSPRKGVHKTSLDSENDGVESPSSIKFRLLSRRESSKEGIKRRILFVSGLSASKIIEFKKGCRKNFAAAAAAAARGNSRTRSKIGKRSGRYKRRVPPILETDLEGISPKGTPTKQTPKVTSSSDLLSESADWGDEMDSDGPLVWPSDQKSDWDTSCDFLNVSPRKNAQNINSGSPKGGFTVSSSVRLRFRPKKAKSKAGCNMSGLGTFKSFKFKSSSHKTTATAGRRVKALPPRSSPSHKSFVVIVPGKRTSMFKSAEFKHAITRINVGQGKRVRAMPLKIGKSVEEFIRLVSIAAVNKKFPGAGLTSEELPIETVMGLTEFDGHEGVDMEFEEENFSFEECMRD